MQQNFTVCLNCGAKNAENAKVCEKCGKRRLQQQVVSKSMEDSFVEYFDENSKG